MHVKTCNKTCVTNEYSDQPAHPCNLISVFADRLCLLQPQGYPKKDKQEPLPCWEYVQADLSLSGHTGLVVGLLCAGSYIFGYHSSLQLCGVRLDCHNYSKC